MKIFNAELGGKIRAVITILSALAAALATPAIADWPYVAPALAGVLALIQILTRFTPVGGNPQE